MLENNTKDNTGNNAESKARVLFLLINAYRINRQLDQALAIGRVEFRKDPEDKAIALVYARTLADSGKEKDGAKILKNLIQKDPLDVDLHINLSQIYIQAKRFSEAEEILSQAQDIAKDEKQDQERLKFQLAALYERKKDYRRAENLFKELIEANPDNATALNYIGYMLADRGIRLNEAVEYVERALVLEPNNGAYLDSLGWAYFKLNDLEKAEQYLLKAVEIVRKDPDIHAHLGICTTRQESMIRPSTTGTSRSRTSRILMRERRSEQAKEAEGTLAQTETPVGEDPRSIGLRPPGSAFTTGPADTRRLSRRPAILAPG